MNKFFEEFTKLTNGEFAMLKFNSAVYSKQQRELCVRFIISAFDAMHFEDEQKQKVKQVVQQMFNGVTVKVEFVRTFADFGVVKNRIFEFFNSTNQMLMSSITDDNMHIVVDNEQILVTFEVVTPIYRMMCSADIQNKLSEFLDLRFMQDIVVELKEIEVNLDEYMQNCDLHIETGVNTHRDVRLVDLKLGQRVYSKGKNDGLSQMPSYICDVKTESPSAVLCGRISNLTVGTYKNKNYQEGNPKSGPAEKPIVKFWLDDTTGRIECVCFPRVGAEDAFKQIEEGASVACSGSVSLSKFNNALSYCVNSLFFADINFAAISAKKKKPVPAVYTTVIPQEYVDSKQVNLYDMQEEEVPKFLKGKTFVVYDLETNSKVVENAQIIEIAAVKIVDGKNVQTFQTLVDPMTEIPEDITKITHITTDMVQGMPQIQSVVPDFYKFAHDAILVGHNILRFDLPILARFALAMEYDFDNEVVDTLVLARKYLTEQSKFSLEYLAKSYAIVHENAHRAMSDVLATAELLRIIAKRL